VPGHLPNLLIVGAAKSGTTSLHAYLDEHPQVAMSKKKELQLFSREDWRDRLDWYREQFPVGAPVRGESSPAYSMDPVLPCVPERARELVPEARIVYMVRDPVERLLAHYVEFVTLGLEDKPFEAAVADYDSGRNVYAMTSSYAHQLERWHEWFPPSQVFVIDQRDLLDERRDTLRRVFRFVEVDDSFWTPAFDQLHNTRTMKLRVNRFGLWLWHRGLYHRAVATASALPPRVRGTAVGLIGEPVRAPRPSDALLDELRDYLGKDAQRLRELTGASFDHWSV
jgi:Sulfotransferase domain